MIYLGIDPGTTTIGFALLEKEDRKVRVIEYGVLKIHPSLSLADKLIAIGQDIVELIDTYHPDRVGMERLFFLRNVTNGIDVAQARGVIMYILTSRGIPIQEFTPLQVKKAITGNGQAKKPQVQKAIALILGLSEIPRPDDAADALAIAYITSLSV